jgi:hypothetical protein
MIRICRCHLTPFFRSSPIHQCKKCISKAPVTAADADVSDGHSSSEKQPPRLVLLTRTVQVFQTLIQTTSTIPAVQAHHRLPLSVWKQHLTLVTLANSENLSLASTASPRKSLVPSLTKAIKGCVKDNIFNHPSPY